MIAVFAGCRYLDVGRWWWPTLDAIREEHGITEVWHGACSLDHQHPDKLAGVDAGIDLWARDRGLAVRMFPAPWALYRRAGLDPKAAGMRRVAAGRRASDLPPQQQGARRAWRVLGLRQRC